MTVHLQMPPTNSLDTRQMEYCAQGKGQWHCGSEPCWHHRKFSRLQVRIYFMQNWGNPDMFTGVNIRFGQWSEIVIVSFACDIDQNDNKYLGHQEIVVYSETCVGQPFRKRPHLSGKKLYSLWKFLSISLDSMYLSGKTNFLLEIKGGLSRQISL